MAYEGGRSMDVPKKNRPNTKTKIEARKSARKSSGMGAQKFFVKTRMGEMAKRGKTGDKAALRKKFQSGEVSRKGFGAPKKKTGTGTGNSNSTGTGNSNSTGTGNSNSTGTGNSAVIKDKIVTGNGGNAGTGTKTSAKDTRNYPATRNMKPAPAGKTGTGTKTSAKDTRNYPATRNMKPAPAGKTSTSGNYGRRNIKPGESYKPDTKTKDKTSTSTKDKTYNYRGPGNPYRNK